LKYEVRPAPSFIRRSRDLLKKYPNMKAALRSYLISLEKGIRGKNIPGFHELWKDRIGMEPYGIGKSGGLRIISYHAPPGRLIVPALIYAKKDLENPPHQLLAETVAEIKLSLADSASTR
jgi:hypothetical protein